MIDVVLGAQWGDEGKGRFVDHLISEDEYTTAARYNGGANAGHTISFNGSVLALHQVPSGVRDPTITNIIGNGALVDPVRLVAEIGDINAAGLPVSPQNLAVSELAHLVLPHHIALDQLREQGSCAQGSTKRGIAYAAAEKYQRSGIQAWVAADPSGLEKHARQQLQCANELLVRAELEPMDIEAEIGRLLTSAEVMAPYVTDTFELLHRKLSKGEMVIAEGAQAASLDIEQAPYPYGTSSHTTIGGVLTGLSVGAQNIRRVIGVVKATKSRVGDGPFVTEIHDEKQAGCVRGKRGDIDGEYGASTGRVRRVGYLDLPEIRHAVLVNGMTELVLNKLDCVPRYGSEIPVAVAYSLDGRKTDISPTTVAKLGRCEPVYETWETWAEDISGVREFDALPPAARSYVTRLEDLLGVPISHVGVGPHADQVIKR
jgi:adenylosuccinate synthase